MSDAAFEGAVMKRRRSYAVLMILVGFLTASALAALAMLLMIASQNRANGQRTLECSTPGRACYEHRTTVSVAVAVYAVTCARGQTSDAAIRACVAGKLRADDEKAGGP